MHRRTPHDEAVARIERTGAPARSLHELLALLGIDLDGHDLAAAGGLHGVLEDPERGQPHPRGFSRGCGAFRELQGRWLKTRLRRDGPLYRPELVRRFLQGQLR